jgi:hypothetical protein
MNLWWAAEQTNSPGWASWLPTLIGVIITAAGGIVGTVWVKRLNRRLDDATAAKTVAESRKADAETISLEVATARGLISDVKQMLNDQRAEFLVRDSQRIEQIKELTTQVGENREQLRALRASFASHSTWDGDAVAALRQHLPSFPDPPPVNFD